MKDIILYYYIYHQCDAHHGVTRACMNTLETHTNKKQNEKNECFVLIFEQDIKCFSLTFIVLKLSNYRVYQLLGESGTYYGVRFGKSIPWVTEFPFGVIRDPQYVGSIMSLLACLSWAPFQYILLWSLGYVFMIHLESNEDPATRAKPIS